MTIPTDSILKKRNECDICHKEIADGDEYYEFPDGRIICTTDKECIKKYKEILTRYTDDEC